jgi:hypothetical protein
LELAGAPVIAPGDQIAGIARSYGHLFTEDAESIARSDRIAGIGARWRFGRCSMSRVDLLWR